MGYCLSKIVMLNGVKHPWLGAVATAGHRMRATLHYARYPDPSPMAQDDAIWWCSGIGIMQFHLGGAGGYFLGDCFNMV